MSKPRARFVSSELKPQDAPLLTEEIRNIYELRNRLEVVTTAPNGSRVGIKGDILLYDASGTFTIEINTDSSTTWKSVGIS